MKKVGGLLGLVMALAVVYFIFKFEFSQGPTGGAPVKQTIDVVGVKNDLIAIAQAERVYLASHSTYATLEQLQEDGTIAFSGSNRRGYNYVAEVDDGQHFRIKATPSDPAKETAPTLTIDETMQVSQP